jgi:RNA 2',3'-cyclic 3'-phosphodiesterase
MFVALDLPEGAREALAAWRDALIEGRHDLRPVRVEALHVTLVFLGWQDESAAEAIAEATFGCADPDVPAPRLTSAELKPVPPRAPRLFALDLDDSGGRAGALQGSISEALATGSWYRPEKRPFWPHITLARVTRGERRVAPLDGEPPPSAPFEPEFLTLYRSTLRPQGALYEPLARRLLVTEA